MTDWLSREARAKLEAERQAQAAKQVADLELLRPLDNGTGTSRAAAARVAPHCRGMRRRVLEVLAGSRGLTREEIVLATGIKENSTNGRCAEILAAGWAIEDGVRDGRAVLKVTANGLAALHHEQREEAA